MQSVPHKSRMVLLHFVHALDISVHRGVLKIQAADPCLLTREASGGILTFPMAVRKRRLAVNAPARWEEAVEQVCPS